VNARGIALLAGLVLLAAVSLLAILAASGTLLQRNMAANYHENSLALENASFASAYAQAWLFSRPANAREEDCTIQCILPTGIQNTGELPLQPQFESAGWWQSHGFIAGYNPESIEAATASHDAVTSSFWLIEEVHFETIPSAEPESQEHDPADIGGIGYYRVFGRGQGRTPNSVAVVESIVARPWNGDFTVALFPPRGPVHSFCRQFEERYDCGVLSWRQRR
jgi:Tfp pilus assembly protein PilX